MKNHVLCIFLLLSFISFSQNIHLKEEDSSKIDILIKKANSFIPTNADSVFYYFEKAKNKALEYKSWKFLGKVYLAKGNVHYNLFQDDLAMNEYLKSDSILNNHNIKNRTSFSNLINISRLLSFSIDTNNDSLYLNKVKKYLFNAIDVAKKIHYKTGEAIGYNEYGRLLSQKNNYKEAMIFLKKSLQIIENEDNNKIKSLIYWRIASNYYKLNIIDSATFYYKKRILLFEHTNEQKELALAYSSLGGFYNSLGQYKEAILFQEKALTLFNKNKIKDVGKILGTMNGLATAYANKKQFNKAFIWLDKAYILKDSLTKKQNSTNTLELEKKYQTQKKEHQITLLKTEKEIAKQQKVNQQNLFITGIGITSLAGLFFFFLYRNRQKTTRKLQELDQLKSNLFANISHEFRTPLALISSPIQQQLKKKNISNKDKTSFEIIQRNTTRLLDLVNQMLDISKIEAGKIKLKIALNDLPSFYGKLLNGFSFVAKQKEINFIVKINSIQDKTWFDKDILEKISTNLLSNALKYTPTKGTVITEVFVKENKLNFIVKNTGEGISLNEISKIFDRFYQLNNHSEGAGIGLALVKELVSLHKGKITVDSNPKQWTVFKITIPVHKKAFKTNQIISVPEVHENAKILNFKFDNSSEYLNPIINEETINPIALIVEDNKDLNNYIGNLLEKEYTIIQATNGNKGINLAFKYIPDIIISDVMMPLKDGIELCNTLKTDERTNHIPIILLTAKAGDENSILGINNGADAYITKPFNDDFLKSKISQLIEIRKKLQTRYSQEVILRPADIAVNSMDEVFLKRVQDILDSKLIESSFHVDEFCNAVGMSRMQLHRKLKVLTGLSTSEFIRSQRLKLAAQLLKTTDINISQVGYSVGFNDHAYFSKCFKEMYQCSPTQYAKK